MGLFNKLKESKKRYDQQRAESKGYKRIVSEKVKLASRQAYAEEAIKVAKERAKAKARRPSFGQRLLAVSRNISKPKQRKVRSVKLKRKVSPVKRYAQPQRQTAPANLNQAIYGGY